MYNINERIGVLIMKLRKRRGKQSLYSYYMLIPILAIYLALFIMPSLLGIGYSFTDWRPDRDKISFVGLQNFIRIFTSPKMQLAIINTGIFTIVTVLGKNILGLVLATCLNANLKSKNLLRGIFYIPSILSVVAIGVVFTSVLYPDGPLNEVLRSVGLGSLAKDWLSDGNIVMYSISGVAVWMMVGYHMTIYLAGYQSISKEYYEAATIDGAGYVKQFLYVSIPMLRSSINMNLMLSLIAGMKVFTEVFVMTGGGPGNSSQVLSTLVYECVGNGSWGIGTAMNMLLFVVVSIITIPLLVKIRKEEVEV